LAFAFARVRLPLNQVLMEKYRDLVVRESMGLYCYSVMAVQPAKNTQIRFCFVS
jgi:hypothetical protein